MKSKKIIFLISLVLLCAVLACQVSPRVKSTASETDQLPAEELLSPTVMEPAAQAQISTSTIVPTATDTEEPVPALPVFSNPVVYQFAMFTPTRGWAVTRDRNTLLSTANGGQTWLDVTPPDLDPTPADFTSLGIQPFFLDENTAWFTSNAAGGGVLYHTQDGGISWITTDLPFDYARYTFLDLNIGYALVDLGAGAGSHYVAVYRTIDSGETWTMVFTHEPGVSKSLPESGSKNGITFRDVDSGWIGGAVPMDDYVYLFYTEDGAETWTQETEIALPDAFSGGMLDVWQPAFVSATAAFLPVRAYTINGGIYLLIYRSTDYGETWLYRGSIQDGRTMDFYSEDEGWATANVMLYRTLDGGMTWSAVTNAGIPTGEYYLGVDFVDNQHGWVLTTSDDTTWEPLFLYRTTDGGNNWVQLLP